jgi:hypothetical protein
MSFIEMLPALLANPVICFSAFITAGLFALVYGVGFFHEWKFLNGEQWSYRDDYEVNNFEFDMVFYMLSAGVIFMGGWFFISCLKDDKPAQYQAQVPSPEQAPAHIMTKPTEIHNVAHYIKPHNHHRSSHKSAGASHQPLKHAL